MNDIKHPEDENLKPALRSIRRRRWFFWIVILIYLPLMLLALQSSQPSRAVGFAFTTWVVLLTAAVVAVALARCPQCGNCFHMNGFLFRPVRSCFHCRLHLCADKKR